MSMFNTSFEMQLRILLILSETTDTPMSADMIMVIDFLTVYGAEFGICEANMHGESRYKYSEIASRCELVQKALRELVQKSLVEVKLSQGFQYAITDSGFEYIFELESRYAETYRYTVRRVLETSRGKTEFDLFRSILLRSVACVEGK